MEITGHLRKMQATEGDTVQYTLPLDAQRIALNELIGQELSLSYSGTIHCIACGRKTKKSFNQGYCYPCLRSLAECDTCIIKPEQCHYLEGTCREPAWGEEHCLQDHFVYLANTSGLKVGITRQTNIPTRWLDQGATQALPIFRVKNRLLSGLVEVALMDHVNDKTDWRKMLRGAAAPMDLVGRRDELFELGNETIAAISAKHAVGDVTPLTDEQVLEFSYPVDRYPEKITSYNFDKTPEISGRLHGIKGQYLILDNGVLNIRKFAGYEIVLRY